MVDAQKVGGGKERQRHLGRHIDRVRVQMVEHHEEDGVLDVVERDGLRNHTSTSSRKAVWVRGWHARQVSGLGNTRQG